MARQRGRLRRRPVPPHDARLLQGAAVHGRRLGHRRDGGRAVAEPHGRASQARDAVHVRMLRDRRPGAARACRRSRASSPRTRSWPTSASAAAGCWVLYVAGYVGAFLTAIYTFRMIFRAFWGEPCAGGARARGAATSTIPRRPSTRPTARSRTPTSASRGPSTTSPSASCPMKIAMGAAGRARRRSAGVVQVPGVDRALDELPRRRRSPTRRCDARPERRAHRVRAGARRRARASPASRRLRDLGGAARHARAHARALRAAVQALRQQVVLRRADRLARRAARRLARALRPADLRARGRSTALFVGGTTGIVRAGSAGGARRCRTASCAPTPRCSCWGSSRRPSTS